MPPTALRALIVDDEPHARQRIRDLLAKQPDFELAGECGSGQQALDAMHRESPDVVFLDVRMPDMDGIEVLRRATSRPPWLVFVTAFAEHALEAFDHAAIDYLMKPFDDARFTATLDRVRRLRALAARPASVGSDPTRDDRLAIRSGGRVTLLGLHEIHWIEGYGTYVRIHTTDAEYLHRETMSRLAGDLRGAGFLRVHRSAIVRLAEVRALAEDVVVLRSGVEVRVSGRHRRELESELGIG